MLYIFLASLFFLTLLSSLLIIFSLIVKPQWLIRKYSLLLKFYFVWLCLYLGFILFFTGPANLNDYPAVNTSPYKLPWKANITRFVAQGNYSFTSHRGFHKYAWDFVMPNGTQVLAARAGKVIQVVDNFNGIGLESNFILIEHADGQRSGYAHIRYKSSLVKTGNYVKQGQPLALSGMVGQTLLPHLHFYVSNREGTSSVPISFKEVQDPGVPLAGHFYTSTNKLVEEKE